MFQPILQILCNTWINNPPTWSITPNCEYRERSLLAVTQVGEVVSLNAPQPVRLSHGEDGEGAVYLHTVMNEIKTPELNERWGMQVSLAGEVRINLRQMCITGSYSYYSCSPNISSPKLRSPWDDKVELVYITLSQQYLEQISTESERNIMGHDLIYLGEIKGFLGKLRTCACLHELIFPWRSPACVS